MSHDPFAVAAKTLAETVNTQAGREVLTYNPPAITAELTSAQIAILEHRREWLLTRDVFVLLHGRKPAIGEANQLGRQLTKRYPVRRRPGLPPYYFLAPAGETPTEFMHGSAFTAAERDELRKLGGWVTARSAFEHLHKRAPTHGELIAAGRDLVKHFPSTPTSGRGAYYFLAPAGTPVPDLSV